MGDPRQGGRVILLVEDNADDELFARRAFAKVCPDARLVPARDGEIAIDYLSGRGEFHDRARHPLPTLILLDLKLPRKGGLEVLEWLRQDPELREIGVIVLTSSEETRDVERAKELGVLAYYVKPVTNAAFLETAKSICSDWSKLLSWPSA
jgi:CheY-like chemotaxis protein